MQPRHHRMNSYTPTDLDGLALVLATNAFFFLLRNLSLPCMFFFFPKTRLASLSLRHLLPRNKSSLLATICKWPAIPFITSNYLSRNHSSSFQLEVTLCVPLQICLYLFPLLCGTSAPISSASAPLFSPFILLADQAHPGVHFGGYSRVSQFIIISSELPP